MTYLRRFLLTLFPPPRKPVTWCAGISLAVFAVLFAGTVIGLELTHTLLFSRPAAFGLSVFAGWLWWLHVAGYAGLPAIRGNRTVDAARAVCADGDGACAICAVRTRDVVSTMYLDVSDSIRNDSVDAATKYVIDSVEKKPEHDEAGLLIFGKTPAVELPPRVSFP